MVDRFDSINWDEDLPISSETWTPPVSPDTLTSVRITLSDENRRVVHGLTSVSATGFISTPSAAPYATWNFGPSRMGFSNATQDYELKFRAQDTSGFLFDSIIGLRVNKVAR